MNASAASARLRATAVRGLRGPPDQPAWARPALLVIAALAGLSYAAGMGSDAIELFYGAAARSMSASWHDFFFGAFDPAGTVTLDKLPGAVWLQALSLRAFGFHIWAIVLPQVLEGVLTVLVLYRAVRRLAGPVAGIAAAAVLAASPASVLLNRGNIPDSLLNLLLVMAADATIAAITTGRRRSLVLAGVLVGLAFQAKMTEAWFVLPALGAAYLLAAPGPARRRRRDCGLALATAVAVSLSWMTVVSLVPAHERPYVDGSTNDSEFTQVFVYNATERIWPGLFGRGIGAPAPFLAAAAKHGTVLGPATYHVGPGPTRLLSGQFGRDDAWFLLAALVSAIGTLVARRGRPRGDPLRTAVILWGVWLVIELLALSADRAMNAYYVAVISPPVAALCAGGAAQCLRASARRPALLLAAFTALASAAYAALLIPGRSELHSWLPATLLGLGIAAAALAIRPGARSRAAVLGLSAAAIIGAPAIVSAAVVAQGRGPFDTPFESAAAARVDDFSIARVLRTARRDLDSLRGSRIRLATETSELAARFILATGREVLPIGGYSGGAPSPTLRQLKRDIRTHRLQSFLLAVRPLGHDPRILYLRRACHFSGSAPPAGAPLWFELGVC